MAGRTDTLVDLLRLPRHGLEQRIRAQRIKVRAGEVERARAHNAREVERGVEAELARKRLQDAELLLVRRAHAQIEQPVEPPGAQQRRVEQVRPVGRAYDEHVVPAASSARGRGDAVELGEELGDDAVHDAARVAVRAALGRDRVELVEEDDAGPGVARALEDAPHVRLGLADVHVEQFGPLDGEEVERARGRDRLGEERLARARRAIQQDACADDAGDEMVRGARCTT